MGDHVPNTVQVRRGNTAITRRELSVPIRQAMNDGIIAPGATVFDYGCGRGDDMRALARQGYEVAGWDPNHAPDSPKRRADVVNLGYVLNVIEDPRERAQVLREAFDLADKVLVVSVRTDKDRPKDLQGTPMADGILTRTGTFQKFYPRAESERTFQEQTGVTAHYAAGGTFYLFKDKQAEQAYLARSEAAERGHKPSARGANADPMDLTIGMALQRLKTGAMPEEKALSAAERRSLKASGRDFATLAGEAEALAKASQDPVKIQLAVNKAQVGKKLPGDIYVHESAVKDLPPVLRLLTARAHDAAPDADGEVVKIAKDGRRVSLQHYPDFMTDPHPAIKASTQVSFGREGATVNTTDYAASPNPPILHRKETMLAPDHPMHATFARLTAAEEAAGLLTKTPGNRQQWEERVADAGYRIDGHDLKKARGRGLVMAGAAEDSRRARS